MINVSSVSSDFMAIYKYCIIITITIIGGSSVVTVHC